jgi:hypothetical protein
VQSDLIDGGPKSLTSHHAKLPCPGRAVHRIGLLRDAQHPQLAALLRDDMRDKKAWRLAPLEPWGDSCLRRRHVASLAYTMARLRALSYLFQRRSMPVVTQDPAQLFPAMDPARAAMHDPASWHRLRQVLHNGFVTAYPNGLRLAD